MSNPFEIKITAVLQDEFKCEGDGEANCWCPSQEKIAHAAERVAAELPRFGEIREAYEFYLLDNDKSMAAQIFAQQLGEILGCQSSEDGSVSQETAKKLRPA
jgi:hypothetical protein